MYILILCLPLISFSLIGLFGFYFGRYASIFLSCFSLFLTLLVAFFIFYEVCLCNSIVNLTWYNWLCLGIYNIEIGFLFDSLSSCMILIISFISFLVHVYSVSYMWHDPYIPRFMSYLSLFTFFMLVLVTADNFFQLFVGWEGVGLCSYLLINFWFTRIAANKAALKAMIMNRIADVFFIFGVVSIFFLFKTTNYFIVFNSLSFILLDDICILNFVVKKVVLITFFLFIGAIGKSAQLGFHTWLADAMEGPTPVSALLHAATMVTAGVFLVLRCSLFFEYSPEILILLSFIGGITAFIAGIIAIFQYDLKKIIAYSTCSQLGYMFFSCGLSNYYVAFFHLFNHAFFKALLFLCAGCLIHVFYDEQDLRKMGGLFNIVPFIYISFVIGSLSIMGFFFLTGFYSKDLILEFTYSRYVIHGFFIYFLGLVSALFTAGYSVKLIHFAIRIKKSNSFRIFFSYPLHDANNLFKIVLLILNLCSIFVGFIFNDLMLGFGSNFWNISIYCLPENLAFINLEFVPDLVKKLPIIFSLFGFYYGRWILIMPSYYDHYFLKRSRFWNLYYYVYNTALYLFATALLYNRVYNFLLIVFYKLSYVVTNKYIDKGLLEFVGPYGIYLGAKKINESLGLMITPLIYISIFLIIVYIYILVYIFIYIIWFILMSKVTIDLGLFLIGFYYLFLKLSTKSNDFN